MKKLQIISVGLLAMAIIFFSCNKESQSFAGLSKLEPQLPATVLNYQEKSFSVDNHKATLGRVLFYDKALSGNNAVSCGSCHNQSHGFAEAKKVSTGFTNEVTDRNSMPIQNLALNSDSFLIINPGFGFKTIQHLFWDGRSKSLQDLMLRPVVNHIEMGQDANTLAAKLNKLPYYKQLVQNAFGKDELDQNIIVDAMSHFVASIRTNDSKVDQAVLTGAQSLSTLSQQGLQLFTNEKYNCISCHTSVFAGSTVNFGGIYGGNPGDSSNNFAANIGMQDDDMGIGAKSGKTNDMGKFKIPDLHNVAVTGPYMHDGRFSTLDEVLDHYSHGIANTATLDSRLKNADGTPKVMNIPAEDKKAIISFLNDLTSFNSLTSPLYSDPFKK